MKRIWDRVVSWYFRWVAPPCPLTDDEWRTTYGTEPPAPGVRAERPLRGTCPGCGAGELRWCADDCPLIDPMDYR